MQQVLLRLAHRVRHAESKAELSFILVNESHALSYYRQSILWFKDKGVTTLSGVVSPESNVPFVHYLNCIANQLFNHKMIDKPTIIRPDLLHPKEAAEWDEWLPAEALWIPFLDGAVIFARDKLWTDDEILLFQEWLDIWQYSWKNKSIVSKGFQFIDKLKYRKWYVILCLLLLVIPIRMTVLVPAELVPIQPWSIRSPLDGTVDSFFVTPNSHVKAGDLLLKLDSVLLLSKLKVAHEALATAEAEYRQTAQQAVFDVRSKAQLSQLQGRIAERNTEMNYLGEQLKRTEIKAPSDGIVLVDDPSEWLGKPVVVGERIMTIADEQQVEIEAWLGSGDLIRIPNDSKVTFFLNASPLSPIKGVIRYIGHESVSRPDGHFAYRLRATIVNRDMSVRVGLKGTARVSGEYVPLIYWILRRPLAFIRPYIGL